VTEERDYICASTGPAHSILYMLVRWSTPSQPTQGYSLIVVFSM